MTDFPDASETRFLSGQLRVLQPSRGYRFSLDAPLLADFVRCKPEDDLLEIGAGCGIIPLLLGARSAFRHLWAVEIQPELAALAEENVRRNALAERVTVIPGDIRVLSAPPLPTAVDLVFANPPFRPVGKGRVNPDRQRAVARHELSLDLASLFAASRRSLHAAGRLFLVHLAEREAEILAVAEAHGFGPRTVRRVSAFREDPRPLHVLLEFGVPAGASPTILPPLAVYAARGQYTPEFQAMITA